MVSAYVLGIYDGSANTQVEVYTNASTKTLGAILLQKYTVAKYFHTIVYYSKKFNNIKKNFSTIDHEMLAIVEALWHWQPYLYGKKLIIHTDHRLQMYFFAQPNLSPHNLKSAEKLADFLLWCNIQYTQGSTDILPDVIS